MYLAHPSQDISPLSNEPRYPSRIWGPTCDSADLLFPFIELPELDIGEWLVFQVGRWDTVYDYL